MEHSTINLTKWGILAEFFDHEDHEGHEEKNKLHALQALHGV